MTNELELLVSKLPEVYQPIWGRPALSTSCSRGCNDRLERLLVVYNKISSLLGRPLRVLDLGCAQGYFSHALSEAGAEVCGIDYLAENIAVCRAIANERSDNRITFKCGRVEEVIESLEVGEYDLVLGLSVFHHMVEAKGVMFVVDCLNLLAQKCECCIFEFATNVEPVHWADAQPDDVEDLLAGFSYVHLLARHETHLSQFKRPLYFASSKVFYAADTAFHFQKWTTVSNALVPNSREGRRRFYFSDDMMGKQYKLSNDVASQLEKKEWRNEVAFLESDIELDYKPKLYAHGCDDEEAWLVRENYSGFTLDDFITNDRYYDAPHVVKSVLKYLSQLEQLGLYHSDVRVWNTLVCDDGAIRLIDYGAISSIRADCSWPHDLFLSFLIFCHEVFGRNIEFPIPTRPSWFNPDGLPSPYNEVFQRLFGQAPNSWSFSNLYEQIIEADRVAQKNEIGSVPRLTLQLVSKRYEEATRELRRHLAWLEEGFRSLEGASQQKDAEIARLNSAVEEKFIEHEKAFADQKIAYTRLNAEKKILEDRLNDILASRRWRFISMLASIKRLTSSK
ncbi:hypothetical protein AVM02_05900 [Brucella anthropi]|uniref:methyltransferase domain-containing protein n=1 Tax=Brucella anthropi TaxID=529 RepID=UPI003987AB44